MKFSSNNKTMNTSSALLKLASFIAVLVTVHGCASKQNSNYFNSNFEVSKQQSTNRDDNSGLNENDESSKDIKLEFKPMGYMDASQPELSSQMLDLSDEPAIAVSFDGVELEQFVKHSLANLLKVDFVIDPQTPMENKKITASIKDKVSEKEYLQLFQELLKQNGLAFQIKNNVVFIFGNQQRRGLPEYDYGFGRDKSLVPIGSQPVFQVIPVNFIDTKSLSSFLIQLSNASPVQMLDPNLIAVRGQRHDVMRAIDIINIVDRPNVKGSKLGFIKLEYIPSEQFITKVEELLVNEGVNVDSAVKFTDLSRQNGVVVHSNSRLVIERVEYWKELLDTPEATDDRQYFLYYPENMEAIKLAEVLQKLMSVSSPSAARTPTSQTPTVQAGGSSAGAQGSASRAGGGASGAGEDYSYVVDENRNVIIIYSTASKYKNILPLLKKLDVSPQQVLIEARLIEVTLTDVLSQGVDWSLFGGDRTNDLVNGKGTTGSFDGSRFSYTVSGLDFNLALNFLKTNSNVKVLSSPRVVVANGESASINVGQEIPVLSTQAADVQSARVLQSIQYRSTGVDLQVEPIVNSSNVISLKISQNISEQAGNQTSGIDSPVILNRSFSTSVIANSGQTLVLGGLIRESYTNSNNGLPGLGDLPIIGHLFSETIQDKGRTELIVMITPRIISNNSDIDDIKNIFFNELTLFEDSDNNN